jgi:DNA recombination protein RmuC
MTTALLAVLLIAGLGGLALLLRSVFDQRLTGMEDKLDRRLGDLDTRVNGRLEGLDGRLLTSQQSAGQTASSIAEKLGRMEGATAQMLARANDLAKLEQALRPPKSRGGFGELLLGNLLQDRLPPDAYQLQYTFRDGERVDAVSSSPSTPSSRSTTSSGWSRPATTTRARSTRRRLRAT